MRTVVITTIIIALLPLFQMAVLMDRIQPILLLLMLVAWPIIVIALSYALRNHRDGRPTTLRCWIVNQSHSTLIVYAVCIAFVSGIGAAWSYRYRSEPIQWSAVVEMSVAYTLPFAVLYFIFKKRAGA